VERLSHLVGGGGARKIQYCFCGVGWVNLSTCLTRGRAGTPRRWWSTLVTLAVSINCLCLAVRQPLEPVVRIPHLSG
jgi:hypothetical protein